MFDKREKDILLGFHVVVVVPFTVALVVMVMLTWSCHVIVVPGYTTTRGQRARPLYLYRGQGQVNTRRDQPGVGGQQLHDLGSSWSLTRVSAPAGGQQ